MDTMKINGPLFKQMVMNGAANLKANYRIVDSLNVFPVPDGDTGTNMRMTIEAGINEIRSHEDESIYEVAKKLSRGMLMGARGNSGVILSQLFRGIYKGLTGLEEINPIELGNAFSLGVTQAYKAVMKPVEGTILTVARESTEYVNSKMDENSSFETFFDLFLEEAKASLERTPDLLDVLKEAGVVDSGGAGFIYIVEGMSRSLRGEKIEDTVVVETSRSIKHTFDAHSELSYGYCTEFILQLLHRKTNLATFKVEKDIIQFLESIGDSIVAARDEDIVKVHVHTRVPGKVLNYCQQFGEYVTLKIENMQIQHTETPEEDPENCQCEECVEMRKAAVTKKFATVSVASGEGLTSTFKEMGVDCVVNGGQSMNPSAEDFTNAFDCLNAENIIVFPNNSNIILAAKQAAKYYKKAKVFVVETKSLAQGYSALTMLDFSSGDIDQILSELDDVIANVTTGLITYAIRDASFDGVTMKKGDFIGICDGKIIASAKSKDDALMALLQKVDLESKEIVTIIFGSDVNEEEVSEIEAYLNDNYPDVEVDIINGKQEIYSYILAIE